MSLLLFKPGLNVAAGWKAMAGLALFTFPVSVPPVPPIPLSLLNSNPKPHVWWVFVPFSSLSHLYINTEPGDDTDEVGIRRSHLSTRWELSLKVKPFSQVLFKCFPRTNSLVRSREGRGNMFALGNEDRKVFFSVNQSFLQELFQGVDDWTWWF